MRHAFGNRYGGGGGNHVRFHFLAEAKFYFRPQLPDIIHVRPCKEQDLVEIMHVRYVGFLAHFAGDPVSPVFNVDIKAQPFLVQFGSLPETALFIIFKRHVLDQIPVFYRCFWHAASL